jgi:hypothetical protein
VYNTLDQVFLGRIKEMAEEFPHCDFTGVDLAPMLERRYVTSLFSVSPTHLILDFGHREDHSQTIAGKPFAFPLHFTI